MAAGWAAHLLVGRGEPNWTQLFLVGIAGSFVGGLLASLVAGDGLAIRPSGLIGSIVGATLLLVVVRAVSKGSTREVAIGALGPCRDPCTCRIGCIPS